MTKKALALSQGLWWSLVQGNCNIIRSVKAFGRFVKAKSRRDKYNLYFERLCSYCTFMHAHIHTHVKRTPNLDKHNNVTLQYLIWPKKYEIPRAAVTNIIFTLNDKCHIVKQVLMLCLQGFRKTEIHDAITTVRKKSYTY